MQASSSEEAEASSARAVPQLRAVLLCDLADSTALVERLGDSPAAELIRRHDRVARDLMHHHGGREIDKTDGFLVLFERPVQAVAFALAYQRALRDLGGQLQQPLRARIGIHVGEVVLWENAAADIADGAKPVEVEGLAKPMAARLMGLARPGQVLLSDMARTLAQRAQGELDGAERVRWIGHGRYRFKGVPQALAVHEVGETGIAPMAPPPSGPKALRELPLWRRPAVLALETCLLLAAIAVPMYFTLRPQSAIAFAERDWVVLGNLRNMTNQPLFDDALEEAFRIGLEQSQFVNVLPDLQVRDSLRRMQLDPDATLTREVASEVATREGARAVILPTIAEVGGRVRISAEVIDPNSGITVFGESADGKGAEAALPAMDRVLATVRERLGESLASIQQSSAPLEKVTTANLDALRAYSLARDEVSKGRFREALLLLDQAVQLDPEFAMAWSYRGVLQLQAVGDREAAAEAFSQAEKQHDRFTARERLQFEATMAMAFGSVQQALERWSLAIKLYPDVVFFRQNLGQTLQWHARRPADAIEHFETVARSNHPWRGYSWMSLGLALTETGDLQAAREAMQTGAKLGVWAPQFEDVLPDLVLRDYDAVEARLDAAPDQVPPAQLLEREMRRAAMEVDRGNLRAAFERLQAALDSGSGARVPLPRRARAQLAQLALGLELGDAGAPAALQSLLAQEAARVGSGRLTDESALMHLGFVALVALRNGEEALARQALDAARAAADGSVYLVEGKLWSTARCRLEAGVAAEVAACVQRLIDGTEPFQTRVELQRALAEGGDAEGARIQAAWLSSHRHIALAEIEGQPLQIPNLLALRALAADSVADGD